MVKVCKECGHPLPELEVMMNLTRQQGKVFMALYKAGQRGLNTEQLLDKVYEDSPSGGPLTAEDSVRCCLSKMQHLLKPHGLRIKAYRNAFRRLEKI